MKLEFGNKSLEYLAGEPYKTRVVLTNSEGAIYPVYFEADAIELSNAELFDKAIERIYRINFPHKAEEEKFREYDEIIKKSQETEKELRKAIQEAKEGAARNEESVNSAVAELTELVNGVLTTLLPNEEG